MSRGETTRMSYPPEVGASPTGDYVSKREAVLHVMAAVAFLVLFQAYLVAPLIPSLSIEFHASTDFLGMLVPAYMLPYGISTLFYGPISDRFGRKAVFLTLLGLMVVMIAGVATANTVPQMMVWRLLGGAITGGTVPISLALLGDIYPYEQRGRPLGWIFGAAAGGMAFGSTLGAFLNPIIGWRWEFLIIAALTAAVLAYALRLRWFLEGEIVAHPLSPGKVIAGYWELLTSARGARTYTYIFLNSMFHSGVYSWLGLYFWQRYHLGDEGIGLALLGYGIPGMLFGPFFGHLADRVGRKRIIPFGILIGALAGAALIPRAPLRWPVAITTVLSLGYDTSHPLLAGISTSLNPSRRGLAMGLNSFSLFSGLGLGALAFEPLLKYGFSTALAIFALVQLCLAILAVQLFRGEDSSAENHSEITGSGSVSKIPK
jgi:predicted MFS family arabinose efflux permease